MNLFKLLLPLLMMALYSCNKKEATGLHFDFGSGKIESGYLPVDVTTLYSDSIGYGIIPFTKIKATGNFNKKNSKADGLTSDGAFYFKKKVTEGVYKVTVTLGSTEKDTEVTIKAESRRLYIHNLQLKKGEFKTVTFIVDAFTTDIPESEKIIALKEREKNSFKWDEYLTIEFNGKAVNVASLIIEQEEGLPKIFIAGDSTVTDQDSEPWASWGQMLPLFLKPNIAVANYAVSGSTLRHFRASLRLDKALSEMKAGDYMIIEFAHNDQKQNNYDPYVEYIEDIKDYCDKIIAKKGQPILITSTMRRAFDEDGKIKNTLGNFPQAMRDYSKANNIPLIDLNKMSAQLYEALGIEGSKKALVHYPMGTFIGQDKDFADNTHFNTYGAFQLAKCILSSMKKQNLDIAKYIKDDFINFNHNKPDNPDTFVWPLSPAIDIEKPYGN